MAPTKTSDEPHATDVRLKKHSGRIRSDKAHQAVLATASAVLQDGGYRMFTIERIAKLSGVSKPTIYRWWPTKAALLIEVFDSATTEAVTIEDVGSMHTQLLEWFRSVWSVWQTPANGEAFRSILSEIQTDQVAMDWFKNSFLPHRRAILLEILQRGADRGELQAGLNFDTIVDYMWGHNWYHLLVRSTPDQMAFEQLIRTVSCKPGAIDKPAS